MSETVPEIQVLDDYSVFLGIVMGMACQKHR